MTDVAEYRTVRRKENTYMEDDKRAEDLDKEFHKQFWISMFKALVAASSTIGIYSLIRNSGIDFANNLAWFASITWTFVLILIHAHERADRESKFAFLKERFNQLRMIKGNQ